MLLRSFRCSCPIAGPGCNAGVGRNPQSGRNQRPLLRAPVGSGQARSRRPVQHRTGLGGQPGEQEGIELRRNVAAMRRRDAQQLFRKNTRPQREYSFDLRIGNELASYHGHANLRSRHRELPARHAKIFGGEHHGALRIPVLHDAPRPWIVAARDHHDHRSIREAASPDLKEELQAR